MASKILVDELAPYSHATDVTLATGKNITGANTQFKITGGANLNHLQTDGAGNVTWVAPAVNPIFVSYAILVDSKASGTGGGTFTSGAWRTRDLNTEIYDGIGITFSTNEFILPAGSYLITWSAPSHMVTNNQSRLYDVTGAAVVQSGSPTYSQNSYLGQSRSDGSTRVTIASGTNNYKIEHRCDITGTTNGFGAPTAYSELLVYTIVEIFKES